MGPETWSCLERLTVRETVYIACLKSCHAVYRLQRRSLEVRVSLTPPKTLLCFLSMKVIALVKPIVSAGHGCGCRTWHYLVFDWLNGTFPHPENNHIDGARGARSSGYYKVSSPQSLQSVVRSLDLTRSSHLYAVAHSFVTSTIFPTRPI